MPVEMDALSSKLIKDSAGRCPLILQLLGERSLTARDNY